MSEYGEEIGRVSIHRKQAEKTGEIRPYRAVPGRRAERTGELPRFVWPLIEDDALEFIDRRDYDKRAFRYFEQMIVFIKKRVGKKSLNRDSVVKLAGDWLHSESMKESADHGVLDAFAKNLRVQARVDELMAKLK